MKFLQQKRTRIILLVGIAVLSVLLSLYRWQESPPCFNADEASFGYNAYSIATTGRDEYGTFLPLRLKSFGDNKLPLFSYVIAPFVGIFGLSEFTANLPNFFLAGVLPIVVYALAFALFKRNDVAITAAFLTGINLSFHIIARHVHEALLATTLITLSTWFFVSKRHTLFAISLLLSLFAYHSSRIFALFFLCAYGFAWLKKRSRKTFIPIVLTVAVIGVSVLIDSLYTPTRLQNLLLFTNKGFSLDLDLLKTEGGMKWLYNETVQGVKKVTYAHLTYFSPQFLVIDGDKNPRFGFPTMSPITPIEYVFMFIGTALLFTHKEKHKWFLVLLFLISPLSASLSWAELSLTRSLFMLVPLIIIASYGVILLYHSLKSYRVFYIGFVTVTLVFFLMNAWDFYLFHYPKRGLTTRSWQCGYKELAQYINENYDKYDTFSITRKNGQPYIFLLHYLNYPPAKYQKVAKLSEPDEYGFGQVESFDKFKFNLQIPSEPKNQVLIGYPDDFNGINWLDQSKFKKITIGTEEMFWIYES